MGLVYIAFLFKLLNFGGWVWGSSSLITFLLDPAYYNLVCFILRFKKI